MLGNEKTETQLAQNERKNRIWRGKRIIRVSLKYHGSKRPYDIVRQTWWWGKKKHRRQLGAYPLVSPLWKRALEKREKAKPFSGDLRGTGKAQRTLEGK